MTAAVAEWVRQWLSITYLEGRVRLLEAEQRRLLVEIQEIRANIAAAERVAVQGGDDVVSRVLSVLRRGR